MDRKSDATPMGLAASHHNRAALLTSSAVAIAYVASLAVGWPQQATRQIVEHQVHVSPAADAGEPAATVAHHVLVAPAVWTVLPFVILLAAIALLPLIPATSHWWDSNLNRFKVAGGLGLLTLAYFAFFHGAAIESHWPAHRLIEPNNGRVQLGLAGTILSNAILQEFVPFIVLLFSLFTISGGIRITGDLRAHCFTNASFMGVGALLASLIGTTGAAMLLIRPLLETNRERRYVAHTIVFFIFMVCNCGGCLLPIGDPPLFLGYLEGVPFLWTLRLWPEWLFVNGLLLLIYVLLDGLWFYRKETPSDIERDAAQTRSLEFSGWRLNVPLLVGVVIAVALLDPSKTLPGTDWHPWMFLREMAQLGLVALSLLFGSQKVREANSFGYGPILEVAALFVGIFITMQPALQILGSMGSELGLVTPAHFFWASGSLSSVLDNAPTYLVFFKTAQAMVGETGTTLVAGVNENILVAISLGSVFMGAMTYIGNGPNFMVRTIAEKSGVKMPSFFGYMGYSFLILLPLFALMVWRFVML